jgi:hypothetical protein
MTGDATAILMYLMQAQKEKPDAKWDLTEHKDRKHRSLDSNSYFWLLVNKIAVKQHISDAEVHDRLLSENIAYYKNEEGGIDWKVSPIEPNAFGLIVEQIKDDYAYYLDSKMKVALKKEDGGDLVLDRDGCEVIGRVYWHIKGTHQMNSKEMYRIIDSTVFEAKQLGIETATPEEIARMNALWGKKHDQ